MSGFLQLFQRKSLFSLLCLHLLALSIYLLSAEIGLSLATIDGNASPVWPATGVAISLIYLFGYQMGWPILLGACLINYSNGNELPLQWVFVIASGSLFEALAGGYFLERMDRSQFIRSSGQTGLLRYFLLAVVPSIISATAGSLALIYAKDFTLEMARGSWVTWWVGDAIGVLFVFPLVYELNLYWKEKKKIWPNFEWSSWARAGGKALLLCAVVGISNYFVFGINEGRPFLFVIFLGLLLAAHLFSFLIVYVVAAAISLFSIVMTQQGTGPFQSGGINDSLVHLEFFLCMVWLTAVVLNNIRSSGSLRRPTWVLLIGWLLTGVSFYSFFESSLRRSDSYFEVKKTEAETMVRETMNGYIRLLESGAALLTVDEKVSRTDWQIFYQGLKLTNRYPGLRGVGVIYSVSEDRVKEFTSRAQETFPGFHIHSLYDSPIKNSSGPYFVITLIEPLEDNGVTVGLDIATEELRREAALRARDSGEARLTSELKLVQSPDGHGYLLLVPFYNRGASLKTIEDRRQNFKGFLFAPIQAKDFFSAATQNFEPDLNLIYARPMEVSGWGELLNSDSLESYVDLAGNTHRLIWQKPKGLFIRSNISASLVGFCGAFFTLILAILVASLEGIRAEAERIAVIKTEEVVERERLWRTLTEMSPLGIFLTDKNSKAIYANKKWVSITGLPVEDIGQGKLVAQIHHDDAEGVVAAWSQFIAGGRSEYIHEFRLMVDNQWRYVCVHTVALFDAQNNYIGYLGTIQDLTERHRNQVALAQSARMSSLGQMAGGVAHEINNPLAIISGHAELLRSLLARPEVDTVKAGEHILKIQATVKRIAKIVRGLRSVVREAPSEDGVPYNIGQVFQDTLELCSSRFQSHDVRLIFAPDIGQDQDAVGHPEQLTQVLLNLLNNAFDAVDGQAEKWVEIISYKQNNKIIIEVSDSGPGISLADQASLFDPFFTTKQVGKGTGLGLTISKSIVESQGGRLYLEASRARTTFVVELGAVKA